MSLLLLAGSIQGGTPGGTVPAVTSNWIWRRTVGDTDNGIRVGSCVADGNFIDWAVASGKAYEYRAEAVGDNGTSSFSAWT